MPTKLGQKTLRREVSGDRVVELTPDGLRIRPKRGKVAPVIPYDVLFANVESLTAGTPARDVETRYYQLRASLTPDGVEYREIGARKSFLMPHGVAYQRAVTLSVNAEKAEKRKHKPTRRRRTSTDDQRLSRSRDRAAAQ